MSQVELKSLAESEKWAKDLARKLLRPCLVLLDGELGAGKTQMVRWMVEELGGTPASSPTFAIHQAYESPLGVMDHVDLYRLESPADLESTGFWDLLKAKDHLIFVEWADRLSQNLWPASSQLVRIEIHKDIKNPEFRRIEFRAP